MKKCLDKLCSDHNIDEPNWCDSRVDVVTCYKKPPLMDDSEPVANFRCSGWLVALKDLSNKWREEANNVTAPPQDDTNFPKHDVAETYLACADELDELIKAISN